ncbi:murein transglycosylase domain-containing protein [Thalassotalea atypica]|uniref:murein transglycosylase domain-containing protein n=1 Tax=Thalassotalea atypica TaxID=2054316 RepID=UPI002573C060|nr:murein transglycosylase domain-containing protein [Thalassotalea atypica]
MKPFFILIALICLSSCKSIPKLDSINEVEKLVKQVKDAPHDIVGINKQVHKTEKTINQELASVDHLMTTLIQIINQKWGKDNRQTPERKKYVKYSNDYQARAIVDFTRNWVTVETIAKKNPKGLLAKAISTTLLTSSDPRKTDIFSSKAPILGDEPFLYQQVLDQDKNAIRYQWRAERYAKYLIANQLEKSKLNNRLIHSVKFPLVDNNLHLRKQKYSEFVLASARKYQVPASLIYGVIETESSFNPYAVSAANAYGLMQVVPSTAGKDVYQKIKKKAGQPSKQVLFDPKQNIDIGSAYLNILKTNYLAKVNQQQSKHFATISAYNGGAGNVLRTFGTNRELAFSRINQLNAQEVYRKLTKEHPKLESRRYLEKVTKAEKRYQ